VTAVPAGAAKRATITLAPAYLLVGIQTSTPARVRLYSTDAGAAADLTRPITQDPAADNRLVLEYATVAGALTAPITPGVSGAQTPPSTSVPLTVDNPSGAPTDVTVTLTYLPLEA
jgi:hypothetical protein